MTMVTATGVAWSTAAPVAAQTTGSTDVRITTGSDDAEENMLGRVNTVSTDLDMMFDKFGSGQDNAAVGLRFAGVAVPQNARITDAHVEFRIDEVSDVPTTLTLRGEAADDAATFTPCTSPCFDISARPTTSSSVDWSPDPWLVLREFDQTSDISSIVQEIVSRPGWASGNALAIIITGSGERTADSYEGRGAAGRGAPLLHVEWENPSGVEVRKLTNGVEHPTMAWSFTLTGPGVDRSDATPPAVVDFAGANLFPGAEYTLCETGIPAGWSLEWRIDTTGDGVPDTIIPIVAGVDDDPVDPVTGYSRVFDPNSGGSNDTRCVNFVADADETVGFQIDDRFPGGDPRSIGFWKNWNTCSSGNQAETAAANGGAAAGWYILDDLLSDPGLLVGTLELGAGQCEEAVDILDKRDLGGKKRASDAAYNLASQLLAAQLNLSVGAETCQAAVDAVDAGQSLLTDIGFDGTGPYLRPRDGQAYQDANELAETLDSYNQGDLCG